jgi:Domain of unknown function (DUF4340)
MKPKAVAGFLVITAVVVAAALVTVADRYWIHTAAETVTPFPHLLDHINDVAEIDIQSQDGTAVLARTGSGWKMTDKGGYPVQAERARLTAIGFGEMQFTERKTARADRYQRLAVGDPGGKDPKARLVTLKNAAGEEMAQLIVGKHRDSRLSSEAGYYVRLPKEEQAWFAPANFEIPDNDAIWLEPRIIHVNAKRVAEITTVQPNGDTLVLAKETPQSPHFKFENLPPDKALKGESVADDMDSIITAIDLVDVKPEADVNFSENAWHTDVKTFDGLDVKIDIVMRDKEPWARLSAAAGEPIVDRAGQPDEAKKFLKTPDQIAAEVTEINARTSGWAYQLQGQHGEKMKAPLEIFLENETALQGGGGGADVGGFSPDAGPGGPPEGEDQPPAQ